MSIFAKIFSKCEKTSNTHAETVVFDEMRVTRTLRDGTQESIEWSDLEEVSIVTTDQGPFVDDQFWVLSGPTGGCLVPSETKGAQELLARLQDLPGFDNGAVIQAMGCAENAEFVCWRRIIA